MRVQLDLCDLIFTSLCFEYLYRTLFTAYKTDTPLPWENRKPLTHAILGEGAAQGSKWTATLGPTSLRRTSGPGMNPVSALFMAEVARSATLTPAQLTANGRTVAVDLEKIDEVDEDDLEHTPVRPLSMHGGVGLGAGGNRFSTTVPGASQFLPNRPDEQQVVSPSSPAQGGAQLHLAAKAGGGISRPDHLLSGSGAGGAGGAGVGGKGRHSSVIKSSAATLLSAGQPQQAQGSPLRAASLDMRGGGGNPGASGVRPAQAVPRKSLEGNGSGTGSGQPTKKLFTKMASFFQR